MAIKLSPVETIPTKNATGSEWILWHKNMRGRYGRPVANNLFITAWNKRGCTSFLGTGCSANTQELREYLESQKIQIERGVFEYVADQADNFEDFTSNFFNIGITAFAVVFVVVFGLFALLIYNIVSDRQTIKSVAKAAASATPGGAAAAVAGGGS
jgi:hypothetical protein